MRRWIHCLIVALLCLTLFVDTAKACWFLRHRGRAQACRPVACRPACPPPCCMSCDVLSDVPCDAVVEQPFDGLSTTDAVVATGPIAVTHEPPAVEHAAPAHTPAPQESVVEHGPTRVVGPQAPPAVPAREPVSIVADPAAGNANLPAAKPMPLEEATPALPQPPVAAREPLPDLKPALPEVAPASNDEPVAEPRAGTDGLAKPTAPLADAAPDAVPPEAPKTQPPSPEEPMSPEPAAPVEDLAGGPDTKAPAREPQEPNLFDLYGDEEGEAADDAEALPAEEQRDEMPEDPADAGQEEDPAEDAAEPAAEDEQEMSEDTATEDADAADTESDAPAAEPQEEGAEDASEEAAAEGAEDSDDPAEEQPESKPAETDPFAAVFAVPNEPMRRWTDDTGMRHAQGWLVELRADRVRILKVNGRYTTVPLESLSVADRDYVSAVGDRLAAERKGTAPATTTTAGL